MFRKTVAVGIVNCYGVYDATIRSAEEMTGYDEYIGALASSVIRERLNYVILCGGPTNPASLLSEAATVEPVLRARLEYELAIGCPRPMPEIVLCETSKNAPQSIDRAFTMVNSSEHLQPLHFVIYCDRVRIWTTRALCRYLFDGSPYSRQVIGLPRRDIHPKSRLHVQLGLALRYYLNPRKYVYPQLKD